MITRNLPLLFVTLALAACDFPSKNLGEPFDSDGGESTGEPGETGSSSVSSTTGVDPTVATSTTGVDPTGASSSTGVDPTVGTSTTGVDPTGASSSTGYDPTGASSSTTGFDPTVGTSTTNDPSGTATGTTGWETGGESTSQGTSQGTTIDPTGMTSTGTGGGPEACPIDPATWPPAAKGCNVDADCAIVVITKDCCGSEAAVGIAGADQAAVVESIDATCFGPEPVCDCAAQPLATDDGGSAADAGQVLVACVDSVCTTSPAP